PAHVLAGVDPRPIRIATRSARVGALRRVAALHHHLLLRSADDRPAALSRQRVALHRSVASRRRPLLLPGRLRVRAAAGFPGRHAARRLDRPHHARVPHQGRIDRTRATRDGGRRMRRTGPKVLAWSLAALLTLAGVGWFVLLRPVAQPRTDDPIALFDHGSIGNEEAQGLPFWIWRVLPTMFPEYLPG